MKNRDFQKDRSFYHCYATANEKRFFLEDFENLLRIKSMNSGVSRIYLFIAISSVKKIGFFDRLFTKVVQYLFLNDAQISLENIIYKDNVGRDFSSFDVLNKVVQQVCQDNDFIMFQNRSARGPYLQDWYLRFVQQFEKFDNAALCGSTINFKDHPRRSMRNDLPHIQTYAFLSIARLTRMIDGNFPGAKETERLRIITEGEMGLSQFFLDKGYGITCLEWPNDLIVRDSKALRDEDVKELVLGEQPFYHRHFFKDRSNRKLRKLKIVLFFQYLTVAFKVLLKR